MVSYVLLRCSLLVKRSLTARYFTSFDPISSSDLEALVLRQRGINGKFHSLFSAAVCNPSVLSSACFRLASRANPLLPFPQNFSASQQHFVEHLSRDLQDRNFNPRSHCINLAPSRRKGEHLHLPTLDLKVVMEAIGMVFDVVYDKKFATFAYGGRAGLGRHTAVRYLKSYVKNPTWWLCVALRRQRFDRKHVDRLFNLIREDVDDLEFVDFVEQLFESNVVAFDLGGLEIGRGFPQESVLVPRFVNIYFDGLDRLIQDIRAEVHKKNPRLDSLRKEDEGKVFHSPVRVYAVRYLDEVLVVTSGSKVLASDVKDRIVKYLEDEMKLKVDKLETSIHSAVSEKLRFMGMELQAVTPSVLHPLMSEKAIRARKKYLKRRAEKAQELKNARETIRKKLGLKILNHVFKKIKRKVVFKFDFSIEKEVNEIFRTWSEEVVDEFFQSRDECWAWHRMLTSGDFLSLKRIQDQLPEELVDAYDEFQENANKYLMPTRASKVIEEEERHEKEEEERKYTKKTVEDLTELQIRVDAPIELVRKTIKLARFTNAMGRPRPIKLLICLDDVDIVKWYAGVGRRWLEFFCCCRNFKMVKTVVNYHLRFSCFLTLAEKHESTKREAIRHYTKDLKVMTVNGDGEVHFPTEKEIRMMGDKNLSDPMPVDGALCLILARLASNESISTCLAHFCESTETVLYRIRLLQNRLNVDPLDSDKWVQGMGAIHECLNKKCLPLCSKHASHLLSGWISLQDIDCASLLDLE